MLRSDGVTKLHNAEIWRLSKTSQRVNITRRWCYGCCLYITIQITNATFEHFCPKIDAESLTFWVQTFRLFRINLSYRLLNTQHPYWLQIRLVLGKMPRVANCSVSRIAQNTDRKAQLNLIKVCTHLHLYISTEQQNVHAFVQRIYSLQNSTNFMCISISNIDDITSHKIFINTYRYTITNANNHLFLRKFCAWLHLNCDPCKFMFAFFFSMIKHWQLRVK